MPERTKISQLSVLDDDERDDAEFRARDRAWSALVHLFDHYQRTENLNYETLGRRIKRSRSQVQRWLHSAFNMNLRSLGLLAEGLDAELVIDVRPRTKSQLGLNYCHPAESARARLVARGTNAEAVYKPAASASGQIRTAGDICGIDSSNLILVDA